MAFARVGGPGDTGWMERWVVEGRVRDEKNTRDYKKFRKRASKLPTWSRRLAGTRSPACRELEARTTIPRIKASVIFFRSLCWQYATGSGRLPASLVQKRKLSCCQAPSRSRGCPIARAL